MYDVWQIKAFFLRVPHRWLQRPEYFIGCN
jgi:hypothetical protein